MEEELEEEEETREAWQSEVQKEREESQRWRVKADNMAEQITLNRQTLEKCQQEKKAALVRDGWREVLMGGCKFMSRGSKYSGKGPEIMNSANC